jgi:hypothetical protein
VALLATKDADTAAMLCEVVKKIINAINFEEIKARSY